VTEPTPRHLAPVDDWDEPEDESPAVVAERAVLGTAIQSSAGATEALAVLRPEFLAANANRVVLEAVEQLLDAGTEVDPSSVLGELSRVGLLSKVGAKGLGHGGVFLHSLMERAGNIGYHAPQVIAAAQQRNIRAALATCGQIAGGPGFDSDVHLDQIRKIVEDATAFAGTTALRPNSETVREVLDALENDVDPGLSTGFPDLDDAIGGMRPHEVIVIGARPGVGKSLAGLGLADHVASRLGLPVLFASLEMTEEQLTQRRISAASKVPLKHIVRHQVTDPEWDLISRVHDRLMETRLFIDHTSEQTLAHIRGRLRAMARSGDPARLLVIDYLGLMGAPRAESRQQQVAALARGVKIMAREFEMPIVLLAQLNRNPETRADKVPVSADLRESGEIEQSADIVILLHRDDAQNPESPRAGEIDLLITKNRQGAQTTVTLQFQGHYGRMVSLSRDWSPSSAMDGAK
jgi:replicative DNA helicase